MIHSDGIFSQSIRNSSKELPDHAYKLVLKEKRAISRILYCGPNFSGSGVALYRILELQYGENYLERIVFKKDTSIEANLFRITYPKFHKNLDSHEEEHRRVYKNSEKNIGVITNFRNLESKNGTIISTSIRDYRNLSYLSYMTLFYKYWKLRNYHRK